MRRGVSTANRILKFPTLPVTLEIRLPTVSLFSFSVDSPLSPGFPLPSPNLLYLLHSRAVLKTSSTLLLPQDIVCIYFFDKCFSIISRNKKRGSLGALNWFFLKANRFLFCFVLFRLFFFMAGGGGFFCFLPCECDQLRPFSFGSALPEN